MSVIAMVLAAATSLPTSTALPPLTDPYQIFANAKAYWVAQRYPDRVQYTIAVNAQAGDKPIARHYTAWWMAWSNQMTMDSVSAEERADPYRPAPGVNILIPPFRYPVASIGGPRNGTGINTDIVGVPVLTPNYAFGIAPYVPPQEKTPAQIVGEIRAKFHDPLSAERIKKLPASMLPTIAVVSVGTRRYIISVLGMEPYGDHRDYHLKLKPVGDPWHFRLRQMWVDSSTFATDKIEQDGNFTATVATKVPWTVTFHDVNGARYIDTESETAYLGKGNDALHNVSFAFENVIAAQTPPLIAGPIPYGALFEPAYE